jgi:hypothetical protein
MERRETRRHDPRQRARGGPSGDRSPLGVPRRLSLGGCHLPTQLQARLPGTRGTHDPLTANRGEDRPFLRGRYPRPTYPSPGLHHPLRSYCRNADARSRPRAGYKPARRRRTRPKTGCVSRPSPQRARSNSFSSPRGANSRNSAGLSYPFEMAKVFFRSLFDSRARKCDTPVP